MIQNKGYFGASKYFYEDLVKTGFYVVITWLLLSYCCVLNSATLNKDLKDQPFFEIDDYNFDWNFTPHSLEQNRAPLTEYQKARLLLRDGILDLRNGKKEQGIDKLQRAWNMQPNLSEAGIAISMEYIDTKKFELALETIKKLQRISPDIIQPIVLEGVVLSYMGNRKEAKKVFEKVLKQKPGAPDAGSNLATILLIEGNKERARQIYKEILEYNPGHIRTIILFAQLDYQDGQIQAAIDRLIKVEMKHKENLAVKLLLVRIYLDQKSFQKALGIIEPVLKQYPDHSQVVLLGGITKLEYGNLVEAANLLERAVRQTPGSLESHFYLAMTYERLKKTDKAILEIDKAVKIAPASVPVLLLRTRLLVARRQFDEAKEQIKFLTTLDPENPEIKQIEGTIAMLQNDFEHATKLFQLVLKTNENSDVVMLLANSQIRSGHSNAGLTTLQNWIKKKPSDYKVRSTLADSLLIQEKYPDAKIQYTKVLKFNPNDVNANNNLAWLFLNEGDIDKAYDHAAKAFELDPENPHVVDTYSLVLLKQNRTYLAETLLRNVNKKMPDNPTISYHLALVLVKQKRDDEAKNLLNKILSKNQIYPEREEAKKLLRKLSE